MSDNDPNPDPTPDPAADPTPDPAPAADKTFTQAELDYHIAERLKRQKAQFADYEDLKKKAAQFDEIDAQSKSDLEKANEKIAALESAAAAAAEAAKTNALRAAVVAEAAKRNVVDPDAAVALIGEIEFDDAGAPTNIAEAMDSLLETRPYLVGKPGARGSADQGARPVVNDQLTREDLKGMSDEAILKAQNEGRLDVVLGRKG